MQRIQFNSPRDALVHLVKYLYIDDVQGSTQQVKVDLTRFFALLAENNISLTQFYNEFRQAIDEAGLRNASLGPQRYIVEGQLSNSFHEYRSIRNETQQPSKQETARSPQRFFPLAPLPHKNAIFYQQKMLDAEKTPPMWTVTASYDVNNQVTDLKMAFSMNAWEVLRGHLFPPQQSIKPSM